MLKLLKHEIKQVWSYLVLITVATIVLIVTQRLMLGYNGDIGLMAFFAKIASPLLGVTLLVYLMVVFFTLVLRFKKSMYADEGYLTAVLPVAVWKVVFSKLIVATLFTWAAFAVFIITLMSLEPKIFGVYFDILMSLFRAYPAQTFMFMISMLIMPAVFYADIYLALGIGQMSNQNKTIMSIIAFFVVLVAKQVLGQAILISGYESIFHVNMHNIATIASTMVFFTIAIQIAASFAGTVYLSKNRLNL